MSWLNRQQLFTGIKSSPTPGSMHMHPCCDNLPLIPVPDASHSTQHTARSNQHPSCSSSTWHAAPSTQHPSPITQASTHHPAPSTHQPGPSTQHTSSSKQHTASSTSWLQHTAVYSTCPAILCMGTPCAAGLDAHIFGIVLPCIKRCMRPRHVVILHWQQSGSGLSKPALGSPTPFH